MIKTFLMMKVNIKNHLEYDIKPKLEDLHCLNGSFSFGMYLFWILGRYLFINQAPADFYSLLLYFFSSYYLSDFLFFRMKQKHIHGPDWLADLSQTALESSQLPQIINQEHCMFRAECYAAGGALQQLHQALRLN